MKKTMAMRDIADQIRGLGLGARGSDLRNEFAKAFDEDRMVVLDHRPSDKEVHEMNADIWITAGNHTYVTIIAESIPETTILTPPESKPAHEAPAADDIVVYVREAGSKFEYYRRTAEGKRDRQRLSTNGKFTHIVYLSTAKYPEFTPYSFHSRKDLADKTVDSFANMEHLTRDGYEYKIVTVTAE